MKQESLSSIHDNQLILIWLSGHSMASEVSLYDQRACEYQCSCDCCSLNSCPDRRGWLWAGGVWHTGCDSYSQQWFQRHRWKSLIVAPVIVDNGCGCEDEEFGIRGLAVDLWYGWDTNSGGDMSKYNKSCQSKCKKIEPTGITSAKIEGLLCTDDGKCCQKVRAKHRCQSINSTNCHYEIFRHEECDQTLLPRLHPSALLPSHIHSLRQSSDTSTKANRSASDGEGLPRRSGEFGKLFRTLLPFLLFLGMLPFLQAGEWMSSSCTLTPIFIIFFLYTYCQFLLFFFLYIKKLPLIQLLLRTPKFTFILWHSIPISIGRAFLSNHQDLLQLWEIYLRTIHSQLTPSKCYTPRLSIYFSLICHENNFIISSLCKSKK